MIVDCIAVHMLKTLHIRFLRHLDIAEYVTEFHRHNLQSIHSSWTIETTSDMDHHYMTPLRQTNLHRRYDSNSDRL